MGFWHCAFVAWAGFFACPKAQGPCCNSIWNKTFLQQSKNLLMVLTSSLSIRSDNSAHNLKILFHIKCAHGLQHVHQHEAGDAMGPADIAKPLSKILKILFVPLRGSVFHGESFVESIVRASLLVVVLTSQSVRSYLHSRLKSQAASKFPVSSLAEET